MYAKIFKTSRLLANELSAEESIYITLQEAKDIKYQTESIIGKYQ